LLGDLEARTIDVAIAPLIDVPARFVAKTLYEEGFVIAMRKGHPFARAPNLDRYCQMQHLVVSQTGDPFGLFDEILAKQKRSRRVALTVPTFMQALALVADSDLLCALPRRLVALYAARFGLTSVETPLPRPRDPIRVIATKAAMMDAGIAWLCDLLIRTQGGSEGPSRNAQWRSSRRH
jgi:DNA-binding transcriptional LysR family regulator